MNSEPWHDERYYEHVQKTHRNDPYSEDPTTKMQGDHLEDRLEAHQEEITQVQVTKEEKTLT